MLTLKPVVMLALVVAALALASCGSGETSTTAAIENGADQKEGASRTRKPAQISTGVPSGRPVLVSERGETLYTFENDRKGGPPTCYGKCAKAWPPILTSARPTRWGNALINQALLGTVERRGGSLQATYAGHPLYEYARDTPADTRGFLVEEFGGSWYLVAPGGTLLTRKGEEEAP